MVISNAESQRRWRQRQKEKKAEERKQAEDSHWYIKKDFDRFAVAHSSEYRLALEMAGFTDQPFSDGAMPYEIPDYTPDPNDPAEKGYYTGIGRAELTVMWLTEAAKALAASLNKFKVEEIESRIKEINISEFTDPAAIKQALNEITHLTKMRDQLSKTVRVNLPQWKVSSD